MTAVGEVDPGGQAYPALQSPEHSGVARPVVAPKVPPAQGAVQADDDSPDVDPYLPAPQGVQAPAPAVLYVPAGHSAAVEVTELAVQAYPGLHAPLQDGVVRAGMAPNAPAGHGLQASAPAVL